MSVSKQRDAIEKFILSDSEWTLGVREGAAQVLSKHVSNDILSLSVENTTPEQQRIAINILREKYEVDAKVVHSKSMGGIDVVRVENNGPYHDATYFKLARTLAQPASWRANFTAAGLPALNLNVSKASEEAIDYIQRVLKKQGIKSNVQVSQSLGGVKVIRIEGDDQITRLREMIPSLRSPSTASRPTPVRGAQGEKPALKKDFH